MNKIIKLIIYISSTFILSPVFAQNSSTPLEDVANALRNNRVVDIVKYFDNLVPITINNNQSIYGHNQAEIVLREYFEKNNPKDLVVMDNGSPNNTSKFMIANFTAHNETFSLYILMKLKDNSYRIQEIRLNKE